MANQAQPTRRLARRAIVLSLLSVVSATTPKTAFAQQDDFAWQGVLREFVTGSGRVDYPALRAHPAALDRFIANLGRRSPLSDPGSFPTQEGRLAYWINAYNALVIAGVAEAWPVTSVRQIGTLPFSFFWKRKFIIGGRRMTLDEIEGILRKDFADPRIHFAIVCASLSCPRLARETYTPENVDRQLDRAAREFINDPRNVSIDLANNRLTLSRIFKWYRGDFAAYVRERHPASGGDPVLGYLRQYADPATFRALDQLHNPRIGYFRYDWGINAVATPNS